MVNKSYDWIIIGAGPAGLKCAEILAKNGKEVLVLEKNKVIGEKVCAGGLTLKDLELKIPSKIIQKKFKKIILQTPLQESEIKSDKPFIATINRKDLGNWMADNAKKAGAKILINSEVTKISNKYVIVNKNKIRYKYLIGADGSNSIVRKYLGLKSNKVLQAFQYLSKKRFKDIGLISDPNKFGHYVWIFPHKKFASIGTGRDLSKQKTFGMDTKDIKNNFDNWCCKNRIDIKKSKFEASIINYDYQGFDFGNIFLVGDAAGFASGLTGEGIYNAIKSGEDVANKTLNPKYECKSINHILNVKKVEDRILDILESNKILTKVDEEIFNLILKTKLINGKFIEYID